jgi:hypothetical protein
VEPDIAPLAKRLAEENNVDWRYLHWTGASGRIVERDILEYLARVMAGEEDLNPTPEPVPEGMEAWPEQDVVGFFGAEASSHGLNDTPVNNTLDDDLLAVDDDEMVFADSQTVPSDESFDELTDNRNDALSAGEIDEDIFLFDDPESVSEVSAETHYYSADSDMQDELQNDEDILFTDTPVPYAAEIPDEEAATDTGVFVDDEFADEDEDIFAFEDASDTADETAFAEQLARADAMHDDGIDEAEDIISFGDEAPQAVTEDTPLWQDAEPVEVADSTWQDTVSEYNDSDDALSETDTEQETPTQLWVAPETDEEPEPVTASTASTDTDFVLSEEEEDTLQTSREVHTDTFVEDEPVAVLEPVQDEPEDIRTEEATAEVTSQEDAVVIAEQSNEWSAHTEEPVALQSDVAEEAQVSHHVETDNQEVMAVTAEAVTPEAVAEPEDVQPEIASDSIDAEPVAEIPAVPAVVAAAAAQHAQLGVAKTETHISAKVATLPLVSYGALLRRRTELTTLVQAQLAISHELGDEAPVSPAGLLVRAAAKGLKRIPLSDPAKLGFAVIQDGNITIKHVPDADSLSFRELLAKLSDVSALPDMAAQDAGLVVADLSDFDVDEAFLNVGAPVLTLGRILVDSNAGEHHSTLSLSGDVKVEQGSRYLAAVTELLNSPVRLVV